MINVQKLRAKIEKHIADAEATHQQRVDDWDAYIKRDQTKWLEKHGRAWLKAIEGVAKAVKDGQVVTSSMLPDSRWSEPYQDEMSRRRPDREYWAPTELVQVLDALDLLDATEVSHTALAKVGINASVMSAVSRYLSRGCVR